MIIIIHEFGHITGAFICKWNIEKVVILPFGGITIFNEDINRPLKEEALILLLGPVYQILFTFFLNDYKYLSYSLLFFNLLPIFPLDGSKILNIFLNKVTSFKKSHLITLYLSFICIFYIMYRCRFNLILILCLIFLFFKTIEEYKKHSMIFNRFLLERYTKNYKFKRICYINSIYKMKRDYRHFFYYKNKYITERSILKKRFDFNEKRW